MPQNVIRMFWIGLRPPAMESSDMNLPPLNPRPVLLQGIAPTRPCRERPLAASHERCRLLLNHLNARVSSGTFLSNQAALHQWGGTFLSRHILSPSWTTENALITIDPSSTHGMKLHFSEVP